MTPETKKLLMQPLYKIAAHYGLTDATLVSFKKRSDLLEKISEKNEDAGLLLSAFLESNLKADRIDNDKEKLEKNPAQWHAEKEKSDEETALNKTRLADLCSGLGIQID